jgi:23S rRNA pseudouridine1911/1915/1917 synthase
MEKKTLTVTEEFSGARVDKFLSEATGLTRSSIVKLLEDGLVLVNSQCACKSLKVANADIVELTLPDPREIDAQPQDIALDIVYEDSDIIVVNKPVGMVVHPAAGHDDNTLVNALLHHCKGSLSGIGGELRPGIVHRIDKDTSGLLVCAKNDKAHLLLSEQLKEHDMSRTYYAIAVGVFKNDSGTVDAPIGRNPKDRKKMAVVSSGELERGNGRHAVTHYRVLESFNGFSLIECELETGRTHQIRVHMSYIGHPLMGDVLYGAGHTKFEKQNGSIICGQCLHAKKLKLCHPTTGEPMVFECELPEYFIKLTEKLRNISK